MSRANVVTTPAIDVDGVLRGAAVSYLHPEMATPMPPATPAPRSDMYEGPHGFAEPVPGASYQSHHRVVAAIPRYKAFGISLPRRLRGATKFRVDDPPLGGSIEVREAQVFRKRHITALKDVARTQVRVASYRPPTDLDVIPARPGAPSAHVDPIVRALLIAHVAQTPRVEEDRLEAAEGWYPDEGFTHPPPKEVRRIRVRLHRAGPAKPRLLFDPDLE